MSQSFGGFAITRFGEDDEQDKKLLNTRGVEWDHGYGGDEGLDGYQEGEEEEEADGDSHWVAGEDEDEDEVSWGSTTSSAAPVVEVSEGTQKKQGGNDMLAALLMRAKKREATKEIEGKENKKAAKAARKAEAARSAGAPPESKRDHIPLQIQHSKKTKRRLQALKDGKSHTGEEKKVKSLLSEDAIVESGDEESGDEESPSSKALASTAHSEAALPSSTSEIHSGAHVVPVGAEDIAIEEFATIAEDAEEVLPHWIQSAGHRPIRSADAAPLDSLSEFVDSKIMDHMRDGIGARQWFPVQAVVMPDIVRAIASPAPTDVCVSAPTGSGKTLAYAIPTIQVLKDRVVPRVRCLVVLPSRNLAVQVHSTYSTLAKLFGLRVALICGSSTLPQEVAQLRGGAVDVVIATPGRLVAHLNAGNLSLEHLRFLVCDEVERLLAQSYQEWLPATLASVNNTTPGAVSLKGRGSLSVRTASPSESASGMFSRLTTQRPPLQKLLFSATLAVKSKSFISMGLNQPVFYTAVARSSFMFVVPPTLSEHAVVCEATHKPLAVIHLLKTTLKDVSRVVVFASAVENVHKLSRLLELYSQDTGTAADEDVAAKEAREAKQEKELKVIEETLATAIKEAEAINSKSRRRRAITDARKAAEAERAALDREAGSFGGDIGIVAEFSRNIPGGEREKVMEKFRSGAIRVLVASDVLARGMDVADVGAVINYDPPAQIRTYVHRAGRTARAGNFGSVFTIARGDQMYHVKEMLNRISRPTGRPYGIHKVSMEHFESYLPKYKEVLPAMERVLARENTGALLHNAAAEKSCPTAQWADHRTLVPHLGQDLPAELTAALRAQTWAAVSAANP